MSDLKLFDRWDISGIKVEDAGLKGYINLSPRVVPKTGARYAGNRFHKSKINVVERLMNKLMVSGHKAKKHKISSGRNSGKAYAIYQMVEETFDIIEKKTKKNPIEVFVKAVENAAPREEIITIEYGGARYPKAVESAPQRRVDITLKYMAQGVYQSCFNKKKTAVQALSEEILFAYQKSSSSVAIAKKFELERQADSSR
ncbi:30S ribosomal protein S7 [archaeon]|jgi:small subunit ribosomal protein S7|nr:30S ribosomal protein S7 [archaeon]MBT4352076.1 30S ribosomal protein S7 [archaeon]MBT4648558.1 30S ribosomal protein S7 [archaeon]MBT6822626.1 30S ribosomal protein S7 [archaeon]MBT7392670.1 30S ribosomal protein S7 [archaeon]